MKPFNLEEAKTGAPVCTRDGHTARIICWNRKHAVYPIIALIYYSTGCEEDISTHTENGNYTLGVADKRDLFMAEEEHEEEHYDISNFKPFDKVLTRNHNSSIWIANIYSHFNKNLTYPFVTTHTNYTQCIPYNEETAHLIGTSNMPPKKYINW